MSGDAPGDEAGTDSGASESTDQRDVVVPMRLYKTITVFSTIIAIGSVLGGFIVLDFATDSAQAEVSEISVLFSILGIGLIVFGAVTYAFSTRFRTEAMGNAKDDADKESDNG